MAKSFRCGYCKRLVKQKNKIDIRSEKEVLTTVYSCTKCRKFIMSNWKEILKVILKLGKELKETK